MWPPTEWFDWLRDWRRQHTRSLTQCEGSNNKGNNNNNNPPNKKKKKEEESHPFIIDFRRQKKKCVLAPSQER